MLTSKARRRVALKTAALAAAGGGLLFGAIPALAAPTPIPYTCSSNGTTSTHTFSMELVPPTNPQPNATVTVSWLITQPQTGPLTANAAIPAANALVAGATVTASGTPVGTATTPVAAGTVTPAAEVPQGAALPLPTLGIVIRPTATGTVAIRAGAFTVQVGTGVYTCTPTTAGGGPAVTFVVGGGATTGSATPSYSYTPPTPTPTPTRTTPRPTRTSTVTATAERPRDGQVTRTPGGGAETGAGGDAGPDGRIFVLVGSLTVLGAGIGGLFLRRRTATSKG